MSSARAHKTRTRLLTTALFLLILGLLLPPASHGQARLTLTFKTEVSVRGDRVLLKDLADIRGEDGALKQDLAEVYITQAPRPGQTLKIRDDYLTHRVRGAGLPLDLLAWNPPPLIVVSREAQEIEDKSVRRIVLDYLESHEPYQSGDWELAELRTSRLPLFPQGTLTHTVQAAFTSNPTHLRLTITFYLDREEAGQVRATAQIRFFQTAVVAARQIEPNQAIKAQDVRLDRVRLDRTRAALVGDVNQAVGQISRRRVYVGRPVLAQDLEPQMAVHRGDRVTIVAENKVLRVSAPGHAQKDGARGETIPVLNLESKKVVLAEIVGPDLVRVTF